MGEPIKDVPHINIPIERNSWNGWCVHYRGFFDLSKPVIRCGAGVEYSTVEKQVEFTYSRGADTHKYRISVAYPCFKHEHSLTDGCSKCHFPTPEEIQAHDEECNAITRNVDIARTAIISHIENKRSVAGVIGCPVCKIGKLSFSRANNGHVHARCDSKNCVAWME